MFSSTTASFNPFNSLLLPSSSCHLLPPLSGHETSDGTFLHHHLYDPLLMAPVWPSSIPQNSSESLMFNFPIPNSSTIMTEQDIISNLDGDQCCGFIPAKKPVKKDRHSKIFTAQGLRDRRVRLSIDISRKFFDLQDMLGFDKASKTLDWLIRKSRKSIKELALMKSRSNIGGVKSFSSSSVSESSDLDGEVSEQKVKKLQKAALHLLAKDSRAKARERARERTKEKMHTRKLAGQWRNCSETSLQILNQQPKSQFESIEKSGHNMSSSFKLIAHGVLKESIAQPLVNIVPKEDAMDQDSILIRRKFKPPSSFGYQQNLSTVSRDLNCINNNSSNFLPNNLPCNWEIYNSTAIPHSTFSASTIMNQSSGSAQDCKSNSQ